MTNLQLLIAADASLAVIKSKDQHFRHHQLQNTLLSIHAYISMLFLLQ